MSQQPTEPQAQPEQRPQEQRQPIVVNVYLSQVPQEYSPPRVQRTTFSPALPVMVCDCLCGDRSGSGAGN